jgi:hypothetical protein
MRLNITKSKNAASLYVIKSVYNPKTQSNSSIIVEKLGTEAELREKLNGRDPYEWAKEYIKELNEQEKENKREILIKKLPTKLIDKDQQSFYNGGYLFLQQFYHQLGLHKISKDISDKYKFTYDLNSILSRLIYGRILFPSSKLSTFNDSKNLLEQPDFELQHVYRALEVIANETDYIQSELYKNSKKISKRNDKILYYDCTNYFFEIEEEKGLKQYGFGKDHKPNPIVEMGLFMDGDGIPLAFSIQSGNTNEQTTLRPLEEKILTDFEHSKFIVCTDAGLSSAENRKFNDKNDRGFITTQSVKKLKKHLKEWALSPEGWSLSGDNDNKAFYNISEIENNEEEYDKYKNLTFYKSRWIKEDGLEQRLIVTYSLKYRDYQRRIRDNQLTRAQDLIQNSPNNVKKRNPNDYKRFISQVSITKEGEVAQKDIYSLDYDAVEKEQQFDGFYAVCTNLEGDVSELIKINHRRWEIEESFRIMKSEFKARPVYLSRDDRIKAHFTTCFLALTIYRYLEKKLDEKFTSSEIVSGLRGMNFLEVAGEGYIPTYTRTEFTDALHDAFGFRTDYQIVSSKQMKKIFKDTKK